MDRINNFTSTDTGTRLYGNATIEDIFSSRRKDLYDMIEAKNLPPCVYVLASKRILSSTRLPREIPEFLRLLQDFDMVRRNLVEISKKALYDHEAYIDHNQFLKLDDVDAIRNLASDEVDKAYRVLYVELVAGFCQLFSDGELKRLGVSQKASMKFIEDADKWELSRRKYWEEHNLPPESFFGREQNTTFHEDFSRAFKPPRDVEQLIEIAKSIVRQVREMDETLRQAFGGEEIPQKYVFLRTH